MTARSCNAAELSDQDRSALERILGRALDRDETVEVRVYHRPTTTLEDSVEAIQQNFGGVAAAEIEAEIDRACQEVRAAHK